MRKITWAVALVLWSAAAWGMDMEEAVRAGLAAHPSIQAVREALDGAVFGVRAARGAFGPAVSVEYGYNRLDEAPQLLGYPAGTRDNWQLTLRVDQPLFTGFALLSALEKAKLQEVELGSRLEYAREQLALAIREAFLGLLQARASRKAAEDSLERLRAHLRRNQAFFETGLRPKLDVLQAQVEVSRAEQAVVAADNAVAVAQARLETLLAAKAPVEFLGELDFQPFSRSLEACLDAALAQRPDIRIAQLAVDTARQEARLAASPLYPQVSARFEYQRSGDDPSVSGDTYHTPSAWQAQAGVRWKIFDWGQTYFTAQQAEKNVRRLAQEYEALRLEVQYEVRQRYLQIAEASKRLKTAQDGLAAAKESLRMAQARYEAQVGTNTDVLDAQAARTEAETRVIQALADHRLAVARLLAAMGEGRPSTP